jgi:hypothetical protein
VGCPLREPARVDSFLHSLCRVHLPLTLAERSLTILSTQLYSSLSLLPIDPPPFTTPEANGDVSHQPEVSLTEYPLPVGQVIIVRRHMPELDVFYRMVAGNGSQLLG